MAAVTGDSSKRNFKDRAVERVARAVAGRRLDDLQRRLEDSAPGTPARYQLNVSYTPGVEVLGYRRDGTITRIRYTFTGNWNLETLSVPPRTVARSAIPYRSIDSFNIPDLQFFSADTSRDAALVRLMDDLSEEVTRQVAMALRRQREQRATG